MKIFIDLGAFNGDSLQRAFRKYPDCDRYIAVEPFSRSFNKLKSRYGKHPKVELHNAAADIQEEHPVKLFFSRGNPRGHSMVSSKTNVQAGEHVEVAALDIAKLIAELDDEDKVVLKIDVEGMEYPILQKLLDNGAISKVEKIFCDWHWNKIGMAKEDHLKVLNALKKLGFKLTGSAKKDEFM